MTEDGLGCGMKRKVFEFMSALFCTVASELDTYTVQGINLAFDGGQQRVGARSLRVGPSKGGFLGDCLSFFLSFFLSSCWCWNVPCIQPVGFG